MIQKQQQQTIQWVLTPVQFNLVFFFFEKNISLKHLKLLKNHFKTNLFFLETFPKVLIIKSWKASGRKSAEMSLKQD